jgi:hypothetical protein
VNGDARSTGRRAPTSDSYWVDASLLAGKYPGSHVDEEAVATIRALLDAGVRTCVDLTEDGELLAYARFLPEGIRHHRVAVPDLTCPRAEQVRDVLDVIREGAGRGIVYLHCWGGCGRTGVVVGCYLVEHGAEPEAALARVGHLTSAIHHKPCPETPEQLAMVRGWPASPRYRTLGRRDGSGGVGVG